MTIVQCWIVKWKVMSTSHFLKIFQRIIFWVTLKTQSFQRGTLLFLFFLTSLTVCLLLFLKRCTRLIPHTDTIVHDDDDVSCLSVQREGVKAVRKYQWWSIKNSVCVCVEWFFYWSRLIAAPNLTPLARRQLLQIHLYTFLFFFFCYIISTMIKFN